jgi:hypothetical protein
MNLKSVLGYALMVAGVLAFVFFRNYRGEAIPNPNFWYILSIGIVVLGFFVVRNNRSRKLKVEKENLNAEIEEFKMHADKLLVDLNACEIITNNYTEHIERSKSSRAQALDFVYDSSYNVEDKDVLQSVIFYETEHEGKKEKFYSHTMYKDEVTLRIKFDRQKETYIYIDKFNRERYYFDLEFLYI